MTTRDWSVTGDLSEEFISLFTHKKNRSRARLIFANYFIPVRAQFTQLDDFFLIEMWNLYGDRRVGISKRNPIDRHSVTEAKKAALTKIMRQVEENL